MQPVGVNNPFQPRGFDKNYILPNLISNGASQDSLVQDGFNSNLILQYLPGNYVSITPLDPYNLWGARSCNGTDGRGGLSWRIVFQTNGYNPNNNSYNIAIPNFCDSFGNWVAPINTADQPGRIITYSLAYVHGYNPYLFDIK